jgi:hypothetical protein
MPLRGLQEAQVLKPGLGFVVFRDPLCAEKAMNLMHDVAIDGLPLFIASHELWSLSLPLIITTS